MVKLIRLACFSFAAFGLFWNLDKPAMWQDEAETALYGRSILINGYPNAHLGENLITAQPSLQQYETNASGAWIWNTWIPCYIPAASYRLFGESTRTARLPFAFAGLLTLILAAVMFAEFASETGRLDNGLYGLALLAFSVQWLLLMRQCRYYSLISAGELAAIISYYRLLKKSKWAGPALVASLLFLLHSFFIFGPLMLAVFTVDAALRNDDRDFQKRFARCAGIFIVLSIPVAIFYRIWIRPGNHMYAFWESLAFLRSFLLYLHQCLIAGIIVLAAEISRARRWAVPAAVPGSMKRFFWPVVLSAAYLAIVLCISSEGRLISCGIAIFAMIVAARVLFMPAPAGKLNPRRFSLIFIAVSLALFSFTASEPWGRYLVALIPICCYVMGDWIAELCPGSPLAGAILCALLISSNLIYVLPVKIARAISPETPSDTVSGMIRLRLKNVPVRTDVGLFTQELIRGPQGYVEAIADYVNHHGRAGDRGFSDADNLSYMFLTPLHMIGPTELDDQVPEWIFPSPWLALNERLGSRIAELVRSNDYEEVPFDLPAILWQNNPDLFYHSFRPKTAKRVIYHLKSKRNP